MTLLQSRDYDQFSVNELLELADVGRSTFYGHFSGKNDLLRHGLAQLRRELTIQLEGGTPTDRPLFVAFSKPLLEHLDANRSIYRHLKGRGREVFLQTLGQLIGEFVRETLREAGASSVLEPRVQYVRGAFLGLMTWWLEHSTGFSAGKIDLLFHQMSANGLPDDHS